MYHQEAKTIGFIEFLINFGDTSQGRPHCVLNWRLHSDVFGASPRRQFKHNSNSLLLYYFRSYSPNGLCEILLKLAVVYSHSFGETCCGRPENVPKRLRRVMLLRPPQDVNFDRLVQMHFRFIIFSFISPNVCLSD